MKAEMSSVSTGAADRDPIFILGIAERSGTNFLLNLLLLHPDCGAPDPIWEDYLVHYADLLALYADSVFKRWKRIAGVETCLVDSLYQALGNGIVSSLASLTGERRLITKTPSVNNLGFFFKLFPRAHLLVLLRDGRSVVESSIVSFGGIYEIAMRKWADAARTILHFEQANKDSNSRYMIVRYEDLCTDLERELRRILAFLELDVETYDFHAAADLPVSGSSELRRQGEAAVHWKPVKKTAAFDPLTRWSGWSQALHERFNWIAGPYQRQLGYEKKEFKGIRFLWVAWNKLMDIKLAILWRIRKFKRTSFIRKYDP